MKTRLEKTTIVFLFKVLAIKFCYDQVCDGQERIRIWELENYPFLKSGHRYTVPVLCCMLYRNLSAP
jgi:hypothetical protein